MAAVADRSSGRQRRGGLHIRYQGWRNLDIRKFIRRYLMWRMFKAAILGVLLGIAGGVIVGQISYVKYKESKTVREIEADAVMYNSGEEDDRVMRIQVDYDGLMDSEEDRDEFTSYVGNSVMAQIEAWLGDDYNTKFTYIEMRHNLVMAMKDINEAAERYAQEYGMDVSADAEFVYEFFDASETAGSAGYYETLKIGLQDR